MRGDLLGRLPKECPVAFSGNEFKQLVQSVQYIIAALCIVQRGFFLAHDTKNNGGSRGVCTSLQVDPADNLVGIAGGKQQLTHEVITCRWIGDLWLAGNDLNEDRK